VSTNGLTAADEVANFRSGSICQLAAFALLLSLLSHDQASASPVEYAFFGTITRVAVLSSSTDATLDTWLPGLTEGGSLFGTIAFDTDTPADSEGSYSVGVPGHFAVDAGGYTFSSGASYSISVGNDLSGGDELILASYFPTVSMASDTFVPDDLVIRFSDPTGGVLSDSVLPAVDLNAFLYKTIVFDGVAFGPSASATIVWEGSIDSIRRVPEPATIVLLSAGLAGLSIRRCRGRRQVS